jgi:hypothetical protein
MGAGAARAAAITIAVATGVSVAALLDPLEGGFVVAALAVPAAIAGHLLRRRERWLVIAGLVLFALAFVYMETLGQMAAALQNMTLVPWLGSVLLMVVGEVLLLRHVVAERRPAAANPVTVGLVLVIALLLLRLVVLIGEYRPWDVPMAARAAVEGPGVRLALQLEAGDLRTDAALWATAVLTNTGREDLVLPAATLLDVVVRDAAGQPAWSGADAFFGPLPSSMPWDRAIRLAPGSSTSRTWLLRCRSPGEHSVAALVRASDLDGLTTPPVTLPCAGPRPGNAGATP